MQLFNKRCLSQIWPMSRQSCNKRSLPTTYLASPSMDPSTVAAVPLCTATEILCKRNLRLYGSLVALWRHLPRFLKNSNAASPNTPEVSTTKGTKWCLVSRWAYLDLLRCSGGCLIHYLPNRFSHSFSFTSPPHSSSSFHACGCSTCLGSLSKHLQDVCNL